MEEADQAPSTLNRNPSSWPWCLSWFLADIFWYDGAESCSTFSPSTGLQPYLEEELSTEDAWRSRSSLILMPAGLKLHHWYPAMIDFWHRYIRGWVRSPHSWSFVWRLFLCPWYQSILMKNIQKVLTLVMTPIVLWPLGSIFLANDNPSDVDISWFAGITHRITALSFSQYLWKIRFVNK